MAIFFIGIAKPQEASKNISENNIASLKKELSEAVDAASPTRMRRAYKSVVRDAEKLLKSFPSAPNRYQVLGIVFQSQKRLLAQEKSERNLNDLLETCKKLASAPDKYAALRLEADLMLSEKELSAKDATLQERTKAIELIVDRYRGTPAEAKSLMMAAQIAPKLQAFELNKKISDILSERFAGVPEVIEFRRQQLGLARLNVLFSGTYKRSDGTILRFPADLIGRQSVMLFWSRETEGYEEYLKMIKGFQDEKPDQFEIFSFNLDELPDSGEETLRTLDLDATIMQLPGGKRSQAFRTYGKKEPVGFLVNAYGHALLEPTMLNAVEQVNLGVRGVQSPIFTLNRRLDDERFLSQLQSLLIGDILVTEPDGVLNPTLPPELKMLSVNLDNEITTKLTRTAESVPIETLQTIQKCFEPAPFRFRLSTSEAITNYKKAVSLCSEAIKKYPNAQDLWIVRNRKIVALMGLWSLVGEPKFLVQAAQEARTSLAAKLPTGADVVPLFCLAKEALREEKLKPEEVLMDLIKKAGANDAPCSAHAAATILALYANSKDLHELYSAPLLKVTNSLNPMLWTMVSLLKDRVYSYRLLKANYLHKERDSARHYMINHGAPPMTELLPRMKLKTLDGRTLNLPEDNNGKLTLLVFVEPSSEPEAEFPINIGQDEDKKPHHPFLQFACDLENKHINKDVTTIAAFLTEDIDHINALIKTRGITCQSVIVPDGLANPIIRRLGVLSADRIPNVFLVRRDGSIAWSASGLPYGDSEKFVNLLAAKVHIETCEIKTACEALKEGEFKQAARIFGGPYLPWAPDRYGWRGPRYHGQAMAFIGMKDWNAALESIDKAIDAQKLRYFRGRRNKNPELWREEAATVTIQNPDDTMVELWKVKVEILDRLGRADDATQIRKLIAEPSRLDISSMYKSTHDDLKNWFKQYKMELQK